MKATLAVLALTVLTPTAALAADPAASTGAAAPAAVAAAAAPAAKFSITETLIGDLLDNPETKAILTKHVAELVANPQVDMARGMTLKQVQTYAGDALTDAKLADIQADLEKLPAK